MKLYTGMGPNPRTVRIFMAEKGIEIPLEQVDLLGGENRRPPYTEKNPAGQLPCLELGNWRGWYTRVASRPSIEESKS